MKEFDDILLFEGVKEVFLGEGPHSFRIILNPAVYASSTGVNVSIVCPDGKPVEATLQRWGRKISVLFVVGADSREGVFKILVSTGVKHPKRERSFWLIR